MVIILIQIIRLFTDIITFAVIASVILSYFMSPYHPVRVFLDRLVEPLLAPIRRVVPLVGMLDFSPLVLIILVQLISNLLIQLLLRLLA